MQADTLEPGSDVVRLGVASRPISAAGFERAERIGERAHRR